MGGQLSYDYHPPIDKCLEMVVNSHGPLLNLETLLRCLVDENIRTWGSVLSTSGFAYISSVNRISGMSLLETILFSTPRVPIDFISMLVFHCPFEFASALPLHFHSLHQEIKRRIAMSNERYKWSTNLQCSHRDFQVGDLVMVRLHVRSSRFYKVLNKIGPNTYVLDIPTTLEIRPTFHVETIVPYHSHFILDPQPSTVIQTLVLQPSHPMPLLPSGTTCREEIETILEDRIISTQREGY